MKLSDLIEGFDAARDIEITGLASDSRKVVTGNLFVALAGTQSDGADFIEEALARGAVAILTRSEVSRPDSQAAREAIWIEDENPARLFAQAVAKFFGQQPAHVAAVTGTNGKTSVASFAQQIWQYLGYKAGSVGTLGVNAPGFEAPTGMTTPDPLVLQKAMSNLCDIGVDHVVFEASSHGLAQHRLDGINISAAAFTNLTRDHFDYHGTQENYFHAKARLFDEVMAPGKVAVLNADCPLIREISDICWARGHKIITVGHVESDIRLLRHRSAPGGQEITINYKNKIYDLVLPLVGEFQAMNALMAAGLVIGCGDEAEKAFQALAYLRSVPGRMEQAGRVPSGARVYVDYAHTPDGLQTALQALKPHVKGKLSVVFGCGGDRDTGKRLIMGKIAQECAERIYVTDDNPRTEEASAIRREILKGCKNAIEEGDRARAIQQAVADLEKGDMLLVAGKGHEQGQIVGDEILDFNDMSEIRSAIAMLSMTKPGSAPGQLSSGRRGS